MFTLRTPKYTLYIFFSTWLIAASFCGPGAFIPAMIGLPHHASNPSNMECEQVCLAQSITNHDVAIGQPNGMIQHPQFKSGVAVIHSSPVGETFSRLFPSNTSTYYSASTKLYQRISTYRL